MCLTPRAGCWDIGYINDQRYLGNLAYLPIASSGVAAGYYSPTLTQVLPLKAKRKNVCVSYREGAY